MPTLEFEARTEPRERRAPQRKRLDRNAVGLIVGAFLGAWHAGWSALVALGLAQKLLDWVLWLHFLNNPYQVEAFNPGRAIMLIAVTSLIGYAMGWVFAMVWDLEYWLEP